MRKVGKKGKLGYRERKVFIQKDFEVHKNTYRLLVNSFG